MLGDCRARALFVPARFRNYDYAAMGTRVAAGLPDLDHIFTVRGDGPDDYAALVAEGAGKRFLAPEVDPLGVKMVLYTSGTTGRPKACCTAMTRCAHILPQAAGSGVWSPARRR